MHGLLLPVTARHLPGFGAFKVRAVASTSASLIAGENPFVVDADVSRIQATPEAILAIAAMHKMDITEPIDMDVIQRHAVAIQAGVSIG